MKVYAVVHAILHVVCDTARTKVAANELDFNNSCGVRQLRPMTAYSYNETECGDFLHAIISSVFNQTGGANLDNSRDAFVSEDKVHIHDQLRNQGSVTPADALNSCPVLSNCCQSHFAVQMLEHSME